MKGYTTKHPTSMQTCQGHEKERQLGNYHRPEETKETQESNIVWFPTSDSGTEKGH